MNGRGAAACIGCVRVRRVRVRRVRVRRVRWVRRVRSPARGGGGRPTTHVKGPFS